MKRLMLVFARAVLVCIVVALAACGSQGGAADNEAVNRKEEAGDTKVKAAFYVNGTLGDKGFFDSAQRGMQRAKEELAIEVKTVEGGPNQADWSAGLESLAAGGQYDVIVAGTIDMSDIVTDIATRYPEQRFIYFDKEIKDVPNVYSMQYSQSEGSFLAGAFAALATQSAELEGANADKVIGFIGGMDIPIINDFRSGYEQGARYVDPEVQVIASYVGDFYNAPKGNEIALAQFQTQQADIIYVAAGGAGLGALEASKAAGKYAIGVDSNQNPLYPGNVLTSMLKNVDVSVFRALDLFRLGEVPFGTSEVLGIQEGGIGLAKDVLYESYVPQSIRTRMTEIEEKLSNGEIRVESILQ